MTALRTGRVSLAVVRGGRDDAASRLDVADPVAAIEAAARALTPVSLGELGEAALLDRVDTKFLLPASLVPEILRRCAPCYRALEVNCARLCRYSTLYFDTADLAFYHAHHAGHARRRKVRVRTYVDTGDRYLEVKLRTNKGRTTKSRVLVRGGATPRARSRPRGRSRRSPTTAWSRRTRSARS